MYICIVLVKFYVKYFLYGPIHLKRISQWWAFIRINIAFYEEMVLRTLKTKLNVLKQVNVIILFMISQGSINFYLHMHFHKTHFRMATPIS